MKTRLVCFIGNASCECVNATGMGGWKLEVFKMAVYMSFPVGLFYYFNQPSFFEDWMMVKRNQLFPPQEVNAKERINKTIDYLERKKEARADSVK